MRTKIVVLLLLMWGLSACSNVPAGYVGVKVYLLGGAKGVDAEKLNPGRYWIGWNQDLFLFPTFTQSYVWTKSLNEGSPNDESISFQTAEGLSVNSDVGISYRVNPEMVTTVFQKYRRGVEEITDIYLRNIVRDALVRAGSNREIESVYGMGKAALLKEVEADVQEQCSVIGIIIERISFVGDFRLPPTVVESINDKIEATQRAQQRQNEVAEAIAEADKVRENARGQADSVRIVAEAQAYANKVLADSLTGDFLQYQAVRAWSGVLPQVTGGGAIPFLNIPLGNAGTGREISRNEEQVRLGM